MTEGTLAGYAQTEAASRGRRYPEAEHPYRSLYARDRDRIVHCRAFRRLEYKTQVFVNHEGDHYRTRLTHSIEVAQIARTVARSLRLNSDLAETLALSHDMGHTPFGHLGEEILDPLMRGKGGFSHNRQALRIVEQLEERYPAFPGLNLTWETREGMIKHSGPPDPQFAPEAEEYAAAVPPPIEAQLIDLVDEIAYNHHDIEDGLESRLLDLRELVAAVPLFGEPFHAAEAAWPDQSDWMWSKIALRGVIDRLVTELCAFVQQQVRERGIETLADVRAQRDWIAGLPAATLEANQTLKAHLRERLYRHPRILETKQFFAEVLGELFGAYNETPSAMPERYRKRIDQDGRERVVCDYIAGMTDRFALQEHRRLAGGPGPDRIPFVTR